jgi:long-subunit fatty acid transport protein
VPDGDHHVLSAGARWRLGPLDITPGAVLVLQGSNKNVTSERTDPFPGVVQTTSGEYSLMGYKLALGASYRF